MPLKFLYRSLLLKVAVVVVVVVFMYLCNFLKPCRGGLYAVFFLQYWVIAIGVPIASILTLIYTFKRNPILGIIVS